MASPEPSGVIFGCTPKTYSECMGLKLFGLPNSYRELVGRIQEGTPLFLFNYETRQLSCGFLSDSPGGWELDPNAFGGRYKAQVKMRICEGECVTVLNEDVYKDVMQYLPDGRRLKFELSEEQVNQLLKMVEEKRVKGRSKKFDHYLKPKAQKMKTQGYGLKSRKNGSGDENDHSNGKGWPGVKREVKFDWGRFMDRQGCGVKEDEEAVFQVLVTKANEELHEMLKILQEDLMKDLADKYNPEDLRSEENFEAYSRLYDRLMESLKSGDCMSDTRMILD